MEQGSQENTTEKKTEKRKTENSSVEADITRGDQSLSQPHPRLVVSVVVLVVRMLKRWMPVEKSKTDINDK